MNIIYPKKFILDISKIPTTREIDKKMLYDFMMGFLDCRIYIPDVCLTEGCYAYKLIIFTGKKGFVIDGANPRFYTITSWQSALQRQVWGPISEISIDELLENWEYYGHWEDKKIQKWMTEFYKSRVTV